MKAKDFDYCQTIAYHLARKDLDIEVRAGKFVIGNNKTDYEYETVEELVAFLDGWDAHE